jgi:plasmid stabilization system protein ParE
MAYRFKFSARAAADVNRIIDRIAEMSPARAEKWYKGLLNRVATLKSFPKKCPVAPEGEPIGVEVRELLYGKRPSIYRILFTISEDMIEIRAVWHGSHGPAQL